MLSRKASSFYSGDGKLTNRSGNNDDEIFSEKDDELNDITKSASTQTLRNISSPSFRKRLEEDVFALNSPSRSSSNKNLNNLKNQKQQEKPPSSESISTPPRPSFIKTPSSPSLSYVKKPTTLAEDVDEIAARLNANCKNDVERAMLYLLANRINVKLLIGFLFIVSILNSLKTLSVAQNVLSVFLFLVQLYNNYHRKNIDMAMSYEDTFKRLDGNEIQRTVVAVLLYTSRVIFIPQHNMMFIPMLFIWFAGANKLYIYSTFWGLFPTFYTTFLYGSCACYHSYYEFILNGYSDRFIGIITEYLTMVGCVWMFSYYLINVTGYLKHKVDKLQDTRKRLESALEARSRFMAHISHEFRCPIMSSIGCLELLKETPLSEKQNDLVDTIVSSNSVLLLLIEDILQIVKIEHENKEEKKDQDPNVTTFNLFESLKAMKGIISGYASTFNVNLNLEIETQIEDMFVHSNSSKLHQILSNLLTNAVKASKQGDNVWLKSRVLEDHGDSVVVRFICQDDGCGIPQHLISSIFEPFVQLQNSSQSKVPSSGLGLTTVSHLIKSMDGKISVLSQVGKGSVFTVDIPFKLKPNKLKRREKDDGGDPEDKRSKLHLNVHKSYLTMMTDLERNEKEKENKSNFNSKIIIAEDNPINRKVIVKMINSLGHETDYVCDGKELVDNFNPNTHKVVITDMNMPNMNGLEAAKVLREKYGETPKIYLLTGNVTISLTDIDEIGVLNGILTKPCSKKDLEKCFTFE